MKCIYGPVLSRRLGRSLGIDPFMHKTCTHNCIYCQLGACDTVSPESIISGISADCVQRELREFFNAGGDTDYITFSGSGEPTLWQHIGESARMIKSNYPRKKLAVITNATTLWRYDVRESISCADLVVPTIAAADEETYLRLHRPYPDADFESHLSGMCRFARQFNGEIWIEVMLVADVNDSDKHLARLAKILDVLPAKYIDINTPVRPPAEDWVRPPDKETIQTACAILGERCRTVNEYTAIPEQHRKVARLFDRILELLARRPETTRAMAGALEVAQQDIERAIEMLVAKKIVICDDRGYCRLVRSEDV